MRYQTAVTFISKKTGGIWLSALYRPFQVYDKLTVKRLSDFLYGIVFSLHVCVFGLWYGMYRAKSDFSNSFKCVLNNFFPLLLFIPKKK